MRFSPIHLIDLLRTPAGRHKFLSAWNYISFPLTWPLGMLYRRLVARRVQLMAVVGSLGKTTTQRSLNLALNLPQPDGDNKNAWSEVVWSLFRVRPSAKRAVLEVGIAKPGQMRWYAWMLRPQVTVVTSIASDHNRSLHTLEITRHEKADMVRALASDGLAVLNGDDPNVLWMRGQTRARVITFGFDAENDVRAEDWQVEWPQGMRFVVRIGERRWTVRARLFGRHMVYPLLAALAVAHAEGADMDAAVTGLAALAPEHGRMEMIALPGGAWVLADDFKGSQESMFAALEALGDIPASRRLAVLGEISEPVGSLHELYRVLGALAGRHTNRLILTGCSGRMKDLRQGALRTGFREEHIAIATDNKISQIATLLEKELRPGDLVLVKGRGQQRLRRVVLRLQGRTVRCDIPVCGVNGLKCEDCPMLERGWEGLRAAT
jgi:UDP-N-acetylmuramyl pentapeptide synthase